jgi:ABC-2 type transport system permease protein
MKTALKFTVVSIKMFFRNKQGLFWTMFLPVLIMVIFGLMKFDQYGKSNLAIVDKAKTKESKQLISNLKEVDIIKLKQMQESVAKSNLKKGDLDLVIIIPEDFSKNLNEVVKNQPTINQQTLNPSQLLKTQKTKLKPTAITLYYNEGRKQQAVAGTTVIKEIFDGITHKVTNTPKLFSFKEEAVNAKNLSYIDFLVPGIIAMAIMQMGVFSIVFAIVQFRRRGIMKRLLVTPMRPIEFITGQVLTRLLVSVLQVVVILGLAVVAFDINVVGNYFLILLLVFLGAFLFISMGFAISSFAKTEESAAPVANIIIFPMLFLSGVFFPTEAMPLWLQRVSYYFPLRFLAHGLRSVMAENASMFAIKTDTFWLFGWSLLMILIAVRLFNFGQEE